jgi:cardiolipin synthase A/B
LFDSHWRFGLARPAPEAADEKTGHTGPHIHPAPAHEAGPPQSAAAHQAQLVPSGPDQAEDTVYGLLLTALFRAQQRVVAVTPYFVPDDSLLTALCLAARRGVQVELVLPARSNHRLADIARARALRDLVAAGGQVRLAAGMVHAKAIVVDNGLALCGSLNLDARSLFLNFELMVAFYSAQDIADVTQWIDSRFSHLPCFQPVQPSLSRDIAEGLVRWLGFQI